MLPSPRSRAAEAERAAVTGSRAGFDAASRPADFDGVGRRHFAGKCFCFWQDGVRALGTLMWGRPLEADIAEMIPFFEIGAHPRFRGHASFVDGRGLESVDVLAFSKLLAYVTARRGVWGPNIGRQAVLHPGGFVGVVVSGALHVARPPYPFESFSADAAADAFAWCGVADLFDEVEELRRAVTSRPAIIRSVRQLLRTRGQISAAALAKELGLSSRTLQRRLEEAGSSLRTERARHVSLQVEELLAGTQLDLDAIAAKVGLASASHLVRHFRGTHGMTPGQWRELRKPRG